MGGEGQGCSRPRRSAPKAKRTKSNPRRSIMEHPAVMQALEILGGELVDIRRVKLDRMTSPRSDALTEPEGGPELH